MQPNLNPCHRLGLGRTSSSIASSEIESTSSSVAPSEIESTRLPDPASILSNSSESTDSRSDGETRGDLLLSTSQSPFFDDSSPIHLHAATLDEDSSQSEAVGNRAKVSVKELEKQFMETARLHYKARVLWALILTIVGYMGISYMTVNTIIDYFMNVPGGNNEEDMLRQDFDLMLMVRGYSFAHLELQLYFTIRLTMGTLLSWVIAVVLTPNSIHDSVMLFFSLAFLSAMTYFTYEVLILNVFKLIIGCEYITKKRDDGDPPFPLLWYFRDLSDPEKPLTCECKCAFFPRGGALMLAPFISIRPHSTLRSSPQMHRNYACQIHSGQFTCSYPSLKYMPFNSSG